MRGVNVAMLGMAEVGVVEAFTPERKYGAWVALAKDELELSRINVRAYHLNRAVRDINRLIAETEPDVDARIVKWECHPVNDD